MCGTLGVLCGAALSYLLHGLALLPGSRGGNWREKQEEDDPQPPLCYTLKLCVCNIRLNTSGEKY